MGPIFRRLWRIEVGQPARVVKGMACSQHRRKLLLAARLIGGLAGEGAKAPPAHEGQQGMAALRLGRRDFLAQPVVNGMACSQHRRKLAIPLTTRAG